MIFFIKFIIKKYFCHPICKIKSFQVGETGTMLYLLFEIILGYLMADFLVGLFHWFKDTYCTPNTMIIGRKIIWPSRLHHLRPRYVTEFSDWDLIKSSGSWTLIWMGPLFYFVGISLFNLTLFIVIAFNDVVHKYTHVLDFERPKLVATLQSLYIIQAHDEHHQHHISPHVVNYCPITPYLNFVLEKINFWRRLEDTVEKTFGLKPREVADNYIEDPTYPAGIKFIS